MKHGNLMLYHVMPLFIVVFPFLWYLLIPIEGVLKGENGIIELSTAGFLFIAIGYCVSSMRLSKRLDLSRYLRGWLLLMIAGATYFALEELSYGQHIFGWGTPEGMRELNDQEETNLHNMHALFDQVPRAILTLGILVGGVVLPLYRKFRDRALSETARFYWQWPTIDCVTIGIVVILFRPVFSLFDTSIIDTGESKEQFFALFIMLYCISIHSRLKAKLTPASGGEV